MVERTVRNSHSWLCIIENEKLMQSCNATCTVHANILPARGRDVTALKRNLC